MRAIFGAGLLALCAVAHGQNVLSVTMHGQPLIYTDAGKPSGCGLRVVAVIDPVAGQNEFKSIDISTNVYASGVALGKVVGEINSVANPDPRAGRRQKLFGAWFRSQGDSPVAPVGKGFAPSDSDKGAYLFQADLGAGMDFILAAIKGKPLQVGIRWNTETEAVYTGTVRLTDEERKQVASCFLETFK